MKTRFIKYFAGILICLALFAAPAQASIVQLFNDVNSGTSYNQAIYWAYENGIIQGYGNGNFGPDDCVRRSELTKMIVEYANQGASIGVTGAEPNFFDVRSGDWFYSYVKEAKNRGYIQGYSDRSFRPNNCVNRAEAMKIAVEALLSNLQLDSGGSAITYDDKVITDIPVSSWYAPYARLLFKDRLVGTDHTSWDQAASTNFRAIKFFPDGDMSRKEVAQMLYSIDKSSYTDPVNPPSSTLGTPSLYSPNNNYEFNNNSNSTLSFTWSSTTGASYYDLMMRLPQSSTYFVTQRANQSSSTYYFNILNSTQGYYWKVRAYGSNGSWKDSAEYYFSFASQATTVGTPTLRLPANGIELDNTTTGVMFQFLPTPGASSYQLAFKMPGNSDFGWWDITDTTLNTNGNIAYFFSKGTAGFMNSTGTFYWKIRAWNSNHTSYSDSSTWTMVYPGTVAQPYITLINPDTNTVYNYGDTITFNWLDTNTPSGGSHGLQLSCSNYAYPSTDHWLEWGTDSYRQFIMKTAAGFTASNTTGFSFNSDIYCHWRVVFYTTPGNAGSLSVTSPVRNIIFRIATM